VAGAVTEDHSARGLDTAPPKTQRWGALDLFRFTAVVLMVQGHTFNVLVEEGVRAVKWYRWHNYVHGYTAPMFMMASGLAFGITTFRAWEAHTKPSKAVAKRIERYLLIIGIGYFLHLPHFSLRALRDATAAQFDAFIKVDALHVIGASLLVAELFLLLVRRRGAYVAVLGAVGLATILLAPAVASVPAETMMPRALAAYLNHRTGSIFPIFPWTGYICAGIVCAYFIQRWIDRGELAQLSPRLAAWTATLLLAATLLYGVTPWGRGYDDFWRTSPLLVGFRIGLVLLFLAVLSAGEQWASARAHGRGPVRWLLDVMGMETLVVYVVHLLVLYGMPGFEGLHRLVGRVLPVSGALVVFAILFATMALVAVSWHLLKKRRPRELFVARMALLATVILYALFAP
jgi:uncharacterized membrane protein